MAKIKSYPFSCPRCRSTSEIEEIDHEHDDEAYCESWQCDGCGAEWTVEFELVRVTLTAGNEDNE